MGTKRRTPLALFVVCAGMIGSLLVPWGMPPAAALADSCSVGPLTMRGFFDIPAAIFSGPPLGDRCQFDCPVNSIVRVTAIDHTGGNFIMGAAVCGNAMPSCITNNPGFGLANPCTDSRRTVPPGAGTGTCSVSNQNPFATAQGSVVCQAIPPGALDACAGQGTATTGAGLLYPGLGSVLTVFSFTLAVGSCLTKTTLSATGTVHGHCGQSTGHGTTANGAEFTWVTAGGVMVFAGRLSGTAHVVPNVAGGHSCTTGATSFIVTGGVVLHP